MATHRPPSSTTKRQTSVPQVHLRRAYDPPSDGEGYRVLVDRLWPRGLRKESLAFDAWQRELAPSDALRRWFGHEPARWKEFAERYRQELEADAARSAIEDLAKRALDGPVTLLFGAHDPIHNQAVVLGEEITRAATRLAPEPPPPRRAKRAGASISARARPARRRARGRLNS